MYVLAINQMARLGNGLRSLCSVPDLAPPKGQLVDRHGYHVTLRILCSPGDIGYIIGTNY